MNDFTKPTVKKGPGKRIARKPKIKLTFSEPLAQANRLTVKLIAPNGRSVPSDVVPRGRTLKITPARRLKARSRYTLKISNAVADGGGNPLPTSKRTFRLTTGR